MKLRLFAGLCIIFAVALGLFAGSSQGQTNKGIVVAVNDAYAHNYFIASLSHLRNNLQCKLPIEIWHSGNELSNSTKEILGKFPDVSFKDIAATLNVSPSAYRGFQIKPKIIELSSFDEVLLIDADVFFFENPEKLFSTPGYLSTGTFFFSDLPHEFPARGDNTLFTSEKYLDRRNFIKTLVPTPSSHILPDIKDLWSNEVPSFEKPFIGDVQESGCVAFNKKKHVKSLPEILKLNEHLNTTYKHIYGDKETFWLGCEIAYTPYHINPQRPLTLMTQSQVVTIMQFLDNQLFYQQKLPVPVDEESVFIKYARQYVVYIPGQEPSTIEVIRKLTVDERNKIDQAQKTTAKK